MKTFVIIGLLFLSSISFSQDYDNEWYIEYQTTDSGTVKNDLGNLMNTDWYNVRWVGDDEVKINDSKYLVINREILTKGRFIESITIKLISGSTELGYELKLLRLS